MKPQTEIDTQTEREIESPTKDMVHEVATKQSVAQIICHIQAIAQAVSLDPSRVAMKPSKLIAYAQKAWKNALYQEVITLNSLVLKQRPNAWNAELLIVLAFEKLGLLEEALERVKELLAKGPDRKHVQDVHKRLEGTIRGMQEDLATARHKLTVKFPPYSSQLTETHLGRIRELDTSRIIGYARGAQDDENWELLYRLQLELVRRNEDRPHALLYLILALKKLGRSYEAQGVQEKLDKLEERVGYGGRRDESTRTEKTLMESSTLSVRTVLDESVKPSLDINTENFSEFLDGLLRASTEWRTVEQGYKEIPREARNFLRESIDRLKPGVESSLPKQGADSIKNKLGNLEKHIRKDKIQPELIRALQAMLREHQP